MANKNIIHPFISNEQRMYILIVNIIKNNYYMEILFCHSVTDNKFIKPNADQINNM